jgi:hypothetical protein
MRTSFPHWYYNLKMDPDVKAEIADDMSRCTSRRSRPATRERPVGELGIFYLRFAEYGQRTKWVILVVAPTKEN